MSEANAGELAVLRMLRAMKDASNDAACLVGAYHAVQRQRDEALAQILRDQQVVVLAEQAVEKLREENQRLRGLLEAASRFLFYGGWRLDTEAARMKRDIQAALGENGGAK